MTSRRKRDRQAEASSEEDSLVGGVGGPNPAFGALLQWLGVQPRYESSQSDDDEGEDASDEGEDGQEHQGDDSGESEGSGHDEDVDEDDDDGVHGGPVVDEQDGQFYDEGEALRDSDPFVLRYGKPWDETDVQRWKAAPDYVTVANIDASTELLCTTTVPKAARPIGSLARDAFVKKRLAARWTRPMSPLQSALLPVMVQYADLVVPCVATTDERANMRDLCALHAINHVLKAREREWNNTALLRSKQVAEVQDQGFTPCRVVFVLPMRSDAYDLVRRIIALSPFGEAAVENRRKFDLEMAADEAPSHRGKPADFCERFAGNTDDSFRFGIRFTRSTMRLYTGFYHSDMIVCSPLGLRTIIGDEGDAGRDFDFLSSVEVLVLDSCEMLQMQNWEHVELLMRAMNRVPHKIGDTDFGRLQPHFVNEWAPYLRQTIALSQVQTPELNALTRRCVNPRKAYVRVQHSGVLARAGGSSQIFQRVPFSSVAAAADERFACFSETLLPQVMRARRHGVLVYVPSYFDYLRIRAHLKALNVDFCHLCEYTKKSDVSRDRTDFARRNASIMLYTERVHFYHRSVIRGTEHVIFYGLPTIPQFYCEVLGFIPTELQSAASVVAMHSLVDRFALERIVGSARATRMYDSGKDTHMFSI